MARQESWTNSDGLFVGFGPRDSSNENAATVRTMGNVEIQQFALDFDNMPAYGTAPNLQGKTIPIPRFSQIIRADFRVVDAWIGGTNIDFGSQDSTGAAGDDDGFDVAVLTAALVANAVIIFDGAYLTTAGVIISTVADQFFSTVVTGTYTAGSGIVTVEYLRPMPDASASDPITTELTSRNPSLFV